MSAMKRLFSALGPTGLGLGVAMGGLGWSAVSSHAIAAFERQELPKVLVITAYESKGSPRTRRIYDRVKASWGQSHEVVWYEIHAGTTEAELARMAFDSAVGVWFVDVLEGSRSNRSEKAIVEKLATRLAQWVRERENEAGPDGDTVDVLLDGRIWSETDENEEQSEYFAEVRHMFAASRAWLVVGTDHSGTDGGYPLFGANQLLEDAKVLPRFNEDYCQAPSGTNGLEVASVEHLLRQVSPLDRHSTCTIATSESDGWLVLATYQGSGDCSGKPAIIRRRRSVEWNPIAKVVEIMIPDDCERITAAVVDRRLARVRAVNIAGAKQVWTAGATGQSTPPQSRIHSVPLTDLTPPPTHPSGQALLVVFETASGSHERWLELPEVE